MNKFILDACCGGRMSWFNKRHPNCLYVDERVALKGHRKQRPNHSVEPDMIMDFRKLELKDNSFKLVVFDPPHLKTLGNTSDFRKMYGGLNPETWRDDIKQGFDECWRVLDNYGVLIFKWNEQEIKKREILDVIEKEPLFGHPRGNRLNTIWFCFMKIPFNVTEGENEKN